MNGLDLSKVYFIKNDGYENNLNKIIQNEKENNFC
jgi:hypothetical protein